MIKLHLRRWRIPLLIATSIFFVYSSFGQNVTFTGQVVDNATQTPLTGATIAVGDSTKTSAITNNNGEFSVSAQKGTTLYVSFVGYDRFAVVLSDNTHINVSLKQASGQISEVVVTALGIRKEVKKIGYATTVVKGDDLTKARDVNPLQSLTGKVAGLTIGASAEMLTKPQVVMRGSTDLLYVVDGVPINSDTWNISADDIETYTVLKGANAAALYGFRGINGAIIITTKRGSKDKKGWQIDLNSSNMFENGFLTVPQAQTEYGRGTNFLYQYALGKSYTYGPEGSNGSGTFGGVDVLYDNTQRLQEYGPRFEGQLIKQYDSPYDPATGVRTPTPWVARGKDNFENFIQTGFLSTNNISLSSTGAKSDIRISYSHTFQKGIDPNTRLNIDNVYLNAGYHITDRLHVEGALNLNVQYSPNIPDASYGPNSYVYMFKVYGSSDYDIRDLTNVYKGPQGVPNLVQYAPEYGRENSAEFIAQKWLRTHDKTDIYGYLKLDYKLANNLNVSLRSQITTWNQTRTEIVPASANLNTYLSWYYFGWYGDYRIDQRNLLENNSDILFTYNKKLGNFNLGASLGGSWRSFKYNSTWASTKDLAIPNVYILSNSLNPALSYSFLSRMQVYSGYYSVDLGYRNYFTLSTTGRVDNLSTLPQSNRTFFYPSASLSTVLTDYLKLPEVISFFKLRASYANVKGGLTQPTIASAYTAVTGNSTGSLLGYGTDLYTSYDGPSYTNQNTYTTATYYNGTSSVNYSNTIANPALKPYTVQSYEVGTDIMFFRNRITFDATYFTSVNGPLIYQLGVAPSTGFYAQNVNGITSLKKGVELQLSVAPFKNPKGFSWNIDMNWSTFKETLKAIYGNEKTLNINGHNYTVGERLDDYYSTKFVRGPNGEVVYGSGGLPLPVPSSSVDDRGFIGHLNPDFTFGISNQFSYKNFSLSFQFDGRIGGVIYDRVAYQGNNGGTSLASASGAYGVARLAEWESTHQGANAPTPAFIGQGVVITSGTPEYSGGQITNIKDLTFAPNTTAVTVQSYLSSGIGGNFDEYYFVSRSFAKLREVTLSYNVPLRNSFFKSATFSLVGRNLLYFAATKDFDIEQYASGFNIADRTVGGTYPDLQSPTARRFGFNINVSF
jgi:TonB-linked SusC/RagA family outer membrane protein